MAPSSSGVRRHAFVDLGRIAGNAGALAATAGLPLSDLTADLRADAYGHGLIPVARVLSDAGVGGLVLSRVEDAAALADARIPGSTVGAGGGAAGAGRESHHETPRVLGAALFGLDAAHPTATALRLVGEVIAVKRVGADTGVSYGYTYRTTHPTTLALVALGFADGVPRVATNRAPVRIGAYTGRVTGRIAMDQFVVDLDGATVTPGERAVLFGDAALGEPTALDWADSTGIAASIITSRLGTRIERVYTA
ncbi:alanine racemase C-terminal domain-containing protein [Leifsonia sp. NPDC058292]|uniref:alanine racemase C-terminal domain-containing protein n=1 Tax=Leifsonia sp. NPDC058292 TaxID=3346428 RepID=UPI0036DE7505